MSVAGVPMFSATALGILDRQPYDPNASSNYELLSGGLIWGDEFPQAGSPNWAAVSPQWVYRYLLAYRASITLGAERAEFRPVWEQVVQGASHWPGLREDRRGERARRRLRAAQRRQTRCLEELERQLKAENAE